MNTENECLDYTGLEHYHSKLMDEVVSIIIQDRTYLYSIVIETMPSKTSYKVGEIFDPSGMTVKATYSDSTSSIVTGYTVSNTTLSYGMTEVTISYTENKITRIATVPITVSKYNNIISLSVDSLELTSAAPSASFTVTRVGNAEIIATSSNADIATITSIDQITGIVTVSSTNSASGSAIIEVYTKETGTYLVSETKTVQVTASFINIYGVEWDWTDSGPTRGVRTDNSANFSDPDPAVNNGTGSSPFDNLMPWAGMVKETRTGGVMVKEPKYWYKWTKTGKKLKLQISDSPVEGFHVDPVNMDKGDGLGELDFSYIGRYKCASGTYKSETNAAPQTDVTRSGARAAIHELGENIWQIDFAQFWYLGMLYLVEFADWDSQTTIGYGCSANKTKVNNGSTDAMQYHTGTTAINRTTYGFTQYRNIENWWGVVFEWMDGCYYTDSGMYVITNPNKFLDTSNGKFIGAMPNGGFPTDMAIQTDSGYEWALRPAAVNGSNSIYVPDYWKYNSSPCLYHGGHYNQFQEYGFFYISVASARASNANTGCRQQERPPKNSVKG